MDSIQLYDKLLPRRAGTSGQSTRRPEPSVTPWSASGDCLSRRSVRIERGQNATSVCDSLKYWLLAWTNHAEQITTQTEAWRNSRALRARTNGDRLEQLVVVPVRTHSLGGTRLR